MQRIGRPFQMWGLMILQPVAWQEAQDPKAQGRLPPDWWSYRFKILATGVSTGAVGARVS